MANREERARIAAETVAIARTGRYRSAGGVDVSIAEAVELAVRRSTHLAPDDLPTLRARAGVVRARRSFAGRMEVNNETTLAAARRLVAEHGSQRVATLNFASAKHPGGGFLTGSQAQEETWLGPARSTRDCTFTRRTTTRTARRARRSTPII